MIFNIKKYAIHDGPGIRTTVFFQDCPLDCWWCHNPECKAGDSNLYPAKSEDEIFEIVLREIKKDIIFYDESGGGVTFSGGEPLQHLDFLLKLSAASKKEGIHTAVDTCGHTEYINLKVIQEYTDLFLYDLKFIDDDLHHKYTGVSNKIILDNLDTLSSAGAEISLRIPLIPGITDTVENLSGIAGYLDKKELAHTVDLLPFNLFGKSKLKKLSLPERLLKLNTQAPEELNAMSEIFLSLGINTTY